MEVSVLAPGLVTSFCLAPHCIFVHQCGHHQPPENLTECNVASLAVRTESCLLRAWIFWLNRTFLISSHQFSTVILASPSPVRKYQSITTDILIMGQFRNFGPKKDFPEISSCWSLTILETNLELPPSVIICRLFYWGLSWPRVTLCIIWRQPKRDRWW